MRKLIISSILALYIVPAALFAEEKFFEIRAKKFSYTPHIITVNKGDSVKIRLISEDVTHGFYLDGYGVETRAHPGQDGSISFLAHKTGRFSFRCSVTCGEFHPYMIGYLYVEPNRRFYGFAVLIFLIFGGSLFLIFKKRKQLN